jgi:hypothetical protein
MVRTFGSNDIWLEIQFDASVANAVDILLHGATNALSGGSTNSVWQLLSKTNLESNYAWTVAEIQVDDGSTNILHFGPFPDQNPPVSFYRAELATNLFILVATNLPAPVGIDYHPPTQSLILSVNPPGDQTNTFSILDTNASLTRWSGLSNIEVGYEVRLATVKTTTNGFNAGEIFFSSSYAPATIGWLSTNGATAITNWTVFTNDNHWVEDLYLDQTGNWSNDLLVVTSSDQAEFVQPFNVYRIHSRTNFNQITSINATHLEGLLTLSTNSRYGPWAGKLLTADQNSHAIFTVDTSGTVTTNYLGIDADGIRLIPTNQDLYCVEFEDQFSKLLKVPRQFFNHYWGDILMEESDETGVDPTLCIVHWNGTSFDVHRIDLWTYFPNREGYFERVAFAPIDLPPDP